MNIKLEESFENGAEAQVIGGVEHEEPAVFQRRVSYGKELFNLWFGVVVDESTAEHNIESLRESHVKRVTLHELFGGIV